MQTQETTMDNDAQFRRLIGGRLIEGARQVTELPEEDPAFCEEEPLYLTWFALGHAAVLFTLALRLLHSLSPIEQVLIGGCFVALVGFVLAYLVLSRMRKGLARFETVEMRSARRSAR